MICLFKMIDKEFFKNMYDSSCLLEPSDYVKEIMIGSQEFTISYNYIDNEIIIDIVYLKCFDLRNNEVWANITDCYHEHFERDLLEDYLREKHYE